MTINGVAELLADPLCERFAALIEFGFVDEAESALAAFDREVTLAGGEQTAVMAVTPPRWPCCPTDSTSPSGWVTRR